MIIGIDPGITGAVAFLDEKEIKVVKCPFIRVSGKRLYDESKMVEIICLGVAKKKKIYAIVEKAQAMPKQGVSSMFNYGYGYGVWIGILSCLKIPFELVSPVKWKRDMLIGIPGSDKKGKSLVAVKRIFPKISYDWIRKDHGLAEALLLAEWGRRRLKINFVGVK